jgi:transcriptional regulator with XRE-family HTH domain
MQEAVGKRIRELRKARGLTQEGVAESAGINPKYFGSIERGEVNLSLSTLDRIAKALHVQPAALLDLTLVAEPDRDSVIQLVQEVLQHADDEKVERLRVFLERVFR